MTTRADKQHILYSKACRYFILRRCVNHWGSVMCERISLVQCMYSWFKLPNINMSHHTEMRADECAHAMYVVQIVWMDRCRAFIPLPETCLAHVQQFVQRAECGIASSFPTQAL